MLVNLNAMPGLGKSNGGFGDFPKFPEMQGAQSLDPAYDSPDAVGAAGSHFASLLEDAINSVSAAERSAEELTIAVATGADIDPHKLQIEGAKAETMIHLASGVSTKMAQSFQTLMNMQI